LYGQKSGEDGRYTFTATIHPSQLDNVDVTDKILSSIT